MPIEIRELVIRGEVSDQPDRSDTRPPQPMTAEDKEKLVQICVERMFEELNKRSEP